MHSDWHAEISHQHTHRRRFNQFPTHPEQHAYEFRQGTATAGLESRVAVGIRLASSIRSDHPRDRRLA